jgi:integrase
MRGIEVRRSADGGARYVVRMRRRGRRIFATFATEQEAAAYRMAVLGALAQGREPPLAPERPVPAPSSSVAPVGPTVADAAHALIAGINAGTVRTRTGTPFKPSVVRKYEAALRLFVVPRVGALPVAALAKRDVQRLVDEIAAEESAEAAAKALTALRVALRLAERDGELEANPCAGVRVPADPVAERPARVLTPEEAAAIVAAAEARDARMERSLAGPLFALAFGTGLRSGELLGLAWGPAGLDVDAGVVRVRRALDRTRGPDGTFALVPPKSRASRRDVPIPAGDLSRLRRHRLATGRPGDGALVFASDDGRPLDASGIVRTAWGAAVLKAGIAAPLPRLHDARHAYATALLAAGLTMHAVARLLGHRDVALVARRYGDALPDELAGAARALEQLRESRAGGLPPGLPLGG